MNFEKLILDIESHPVVTAIAAFLIFFAGYNIFKKPSSSAAQPGTATGPPLPTVYETYNQAYNSYPTTPATAGDKAVSPFVPPVANGTIWIGTATGRLFFGTSQANRQLLSSIFPPGTTFRHDSVNIWYTVTGYAEAKYGQTISAHQPK